MQRLIKWVEQARVSQSPLLQKHMRQCSSSAASYLVPTTAKLSKYWVGDGDEIGFVMSMMLRLTFSLEETHVSEVQINKRVPEYLLSGKETAFVSCVFCRTCRVSGRSTFTSSCFHLAY